VPVHATKAYSGSRVTAALILNLCTGQRWAFNSTLRVIYSREIKPLPTDQEAGGHFGEDKIILLLMGFESLTIQPEA